MKVVYEIKNLGRDKWSGEVVAQSEEQEHVEMALMLAAEKHLMSRDIYFRGDVDSGSFFVGGFRKVGEYRKKNNQEALS